MSEYYSSNTFNKKKSQYLNIKKCLKFGPYFSCSSKCECFFPPLSNNVLQRCRDKFASLPERGHPRVSSSASWDWDFPRISRFFFCIHQSANTNGAFPRISFTLFSLWTFRNIPYYFFLCPFSISRVMNEKKSSKFEREDKSKENPLLYNGIFFSFTRIFLWSYRKIPYYFFLCPVSISRVMNEKINSKFEREDKSNGNPLL